MQKLLFDTSILIDHLRGHSTATTFLRQEKQGAEFLTSAVTVAELYAGAHTLNEKIKIETILTFFQVIPIDRELSVVGGEIRNKYKKSHNTDLMDALIAATAQHHDATLVTLNTKHFPMIKTIKPY